MTTQPHPQVSPTDLPLFAAPPARPQARRLAGQTPTNNGQPAPAAHHLDEPTPPPITHTGAQPNPFKPRSETEPELPLNSTPVDQQAVREIQAAVSELLTDRDGQDARTVIADEVTAYNQRRLHVGTPALNPDAQAQLGQAVFDAVFGLGRLAPLISIPGLQNIEVRGHDQTTWLIFGDRPPVRGPAVCDSPEELIELVARLARSGATERPFDNAHPHVDLTLPDMSRLSASYRFTPYPVLTIRIHRYVDIDLPTLQRMGMLSASMAAFLTAMVRAGKSLVIAGVPEAGKALALDTPIPTPHGWTTMQWLRAGDLVFDEQGKPCQVTMAHPVQSGRPCYRVEFNDGSSIVADADHLWRVTDLNSRARQRNRATRPQRIKLSAQRWARLVEQVESEAAVPDLNLTVAQLVDRFGVEHANIVRDIAYSLSPSGHVVMPFRVPREVRTYSLQAVGKELLQRRLARPLRAGPAHQILTTQQLAESDVWDPNRPWYKHNFQIELTGALQYPRQELPIDPYVLGIWLGDGSSSCARISTADPEVVDTFRKSGYPCDRIRDDRYDYQVGGGLQGRLRHLGLLGDKHVPRLYLQADVDQRTALLQGLMDSDGTCDHRRGRVCFDNTNETLARQVQDLAIGLGYRATLTSKLVKIRGHEAGTSYKVAWTTRDPMFRLPRKRILQDRCTAGPHSRSIVQITPVESVPVRCITVDSPSSLYLAGKGCIPTHNTTLTRGVLNVLDPLVAIGTIETEDELGLHTLPHRHARVWPAWELIGGGEVINGKAAGSLTVNDLIPPALRANVQVLVVGEVRGHEVIAMLEAMQGTQNSVSTVHAKNGRDAVERLVTCATKYGQVDTTWAYRQVAQLVDAIVHVNLIDERHLGGRQHRFIDEIVLPELSGDGAAGYSVPAIYKPGPDGRGIPDPAHTPPWLDELERYGFDPAWLHDTSWDTSLDLIHPIRRRDQ